MPVHQSRILIITWTNTQYQMTQVRDEVTQQYSTLEAWNVSEKEFPKDGSLAEKLYFLLRYAILAPSGHNTQPWLFKIIENNLIEIHADRSRALPLVDPDERELIISCGAALYNLRLAANHFGIADEVQLLPDKNNNDNPDLLARISLQEDSQGKTKR